MISALRHHRRDSMAGLLAGLLIALGCIAAPARASISAAQRLADTYSPIVMMRTQANGLCDSSEEQFWPPTSVDVVLGNPRVKLMVHIGHTNRLIKWAPTAADIAGRTEGTYLDLPGSPLSPGCTYAKDFAALRRAGHAPDVTYAHLDHEPGHPGLALQYWFYYYFNQFNDLHESDWEGMQITFAAETPGQALETGPDEIVVFQHSGGEHTSWDDSRVQKEGTHPVVYSAAGSHATFYSAALWLGNGQNGSGVGCDNTTEPVTAFRPRAILLPDSPVGTGPFAWTSFTGRWGQREAGFNNGPAGPNTKTVWREPFTWMDNTRTASPQVPGGGLLGPSVANAFCGAVATVTGYLNLAAKSRTQALGLGVGVLLVIVVLISLTTWRPVRLSPLHQARALGQILLTSARMYGHYALKLLLIALSSLLLLAVFEGLELLVFGALSSDSAGLTFGDSNVSVSVTTPVGIGRTIVAPIASGAVIAFMMNLDRTGDTGVLAAWAVVKRRFWRLLLVQLLADFLVILLMVTIIGIPYGIKKFIDWQLAQQQVLFEDASIREAFRRSTHLVRGHWWHTGVTAGTLWLISQIPGPALGFALLFTTVPVNTVNIIGSVVFVFLIPFVVIGRTLLYFDLQARSAEQPERWTRTRAVWRRLRGPAPAPRGSISSA
jgi:hypothetical protein